jgi:hypothetical protein
MYIFGKGRIIEGLAVFQQSGRRFHEHHRVVGVIEMLHLRDVFFIIQPDAENFHELSVSEFMG